ncbi:MAG: hypothetical protein OEV44_00780 [Spirochaetota bacterium]|nr:hypothetical protein [Spirochaetota bacterium]
MNNLINYGDNKNNDQKEKQWSINCKLHQKQEIKELEKKSTI